MRRATVALLLTAATLSAAACGRTATTANEACKGHGGVLDTDRRGRVVTCVDHVVRPWRMEG